MAGVLAAAIAMEDLRRPLHWNCAATEAISSASTTRWLRISVCIDQPQPGD